MTPCDAYTRQTLERFLGGDLPEGLSSEVEGHVEECRSCRRVVRQLTGLASSAGAALPETSDDAAELRESFVDRLLDACRSPSTPVPPDVGRYEVLSFLGKGGMGAVWLAFDKQERREVALKVLPSRDGLSGDEADRLLNEALAAAKCSHDGIVRVYDIGLQESDRTPYLSLEFCPGGSLAKRLDAGRPLPPKTAARIVEAVAAAVHHAHENNIIHRDLKPENILIADAPDTPLETCRVKVADFGLAKRLGARGATRTGVVAGTIAYMSPEQLERQREVNGRSDVFALGVVLYQLLTGRLPFDAADGLAVSKKILNDDPAPPRRLCPDLAADIETICLKCLEKNPARRYASAADLAADLARFIDGRKIDARPPSALRTAADWVARRQWLLAWSVAAAAVVGGIVVGGYFWLGKLRSDADAVQSRDSLRASLAQTMTDFDHQFRLGADREGRKWNTIRDDLAGKVPIFAKFADRADPDPADVEDLGDIYVRLAWFAAVDANRPLAAEYAAKARDLFESLTAGRFAPAHVRRKRANADIDLGLLRVLEGNPAEARPYYEEAIRRHKSIVAAFPDDRESVYDLVTAYTVLGEVLEAEKQFAAAQEAFASACDLQSGRIASETAMVADVAYRSAIFGQWGRSLERVGRKQEAERAFDEAVDAIDRNAAASPAYDLVKGLSAGPTPVPAGVARRQVTTLVQLIGRTDASAQVQNLVDHFTARCAARPADVRVRHRLARCLYLSAMVRFGVGWIGDGTEAAGRCEALYAELRAAKPDDVGLALEEGQLLVYTALALMASGRPADIERWGNKGLALLEGPAAKKDTSERRKVLIRDLYLVRALARSAGSRPLDALFDFETAAGHDPTIMSVSTVATSYAAAVAKVRRRMVADLLRKGQFDEAVRDAEALARLPHAPGEALYDGACVLAVAAASEPAAKEARAARAVALLRMAFAAGFGKDPIQAATGIAGDPVEHARRDADLAGLRDREDFKALLAGRAGVR